MGARSRPLVQVGRWPAGDGVDPWFTAGCAVCVWLRPLGDWVRWRLGMVWTFPRAGAAVVVGESAPSVRALHPVGRTSVRYGQKGTGAAAAIGGKRLLIPSGNTVNDGLCGRALGLACGLLLGLCMSNTHH